VIAQEGGQNGHRCACASGRMTLSRPFTTTCSDGRVDPTSNASADQSPIACLFADAAGRRAGRMADAGWRADAQTAARRSLLSTAPWPG
jgi:hypothetical protein